MIRGKSKLIAAGYVVLACTALMCTSTLAYLIHQDMALNTFVVGSQVSEINEIWNPPTEMKSGTDYTKKVTVKNTGTSDCYVRVFAEIMDDKAGKAVGIDWNTEDWTSKQSDGYYYYKTALTPGDTTEPLFTTLSISADLQEFDMIVYEESVQASGSASPQKAFEF